MNFVSDAINRPGAVSRRIKCLTVADDFTRECVDITADFGIGGEYVTRLLDRAATFRGYPQAVRTYNGPEFTCRALMTWAQKHGIRHILIEPGSPMQNAYIESFNGTSGMSASMRTGFNPWSRHAKLLPHRGLITTK